MAQVAAAGNHTVHLEWLSTRAQLVHSWPIDPDGYGRSMTVMEIVQPGF